MLEVDTWEHPMLMLQQDGERNDRGALVEKLIRELGLGAEQSGWPMPEVKLKKDENLNRVGGGVDFS